MIGASEDDCRLLVSKQFLIPFETGVVVIRHWRIHNYIQKDRYKETMYKAEKSALEQDQSGAYQLLDTPCIHSVSRMDSQVRLGEGSSDKDSTGKDSVGESKGRKRPTPTREQYGEYGWVKLTREEHQRLVSEYGLLEVNRAITYVDESAQSTGNKNRWKDWNLVIRKCIRDGWGKNQNRQQQQSGNVFMEIANDLGGDPF